MDVLNINLDLDHVRIETLKNLELTNVFNDILNLDHVWIEFYKGKEKKIDSRITSES